MRVAVAFAGAVGGWGGAIPFGRGAPSAPPSGIFNITAACWRRTLLETSVRGQQVTTFVHSWSTGLRLLIERELRPTSSHFEAQVAFPDAPDLAHGAMPGKLRCASKGNADKHYPFRNLLSQWTSRLKVMTLVLAHQHATGFDFDIVLLTRLDSCPCQRDPIVADSPAFALLPGKLLRAGIMRKPKGSPPCRTPSCSRWLGFRGNYLPAAALQRSAVPLHDPPRADDSLLLAASAVAMHSLVADIVANLPNTTLSLGGCDPHAHLAVAMLRCFRMEQLDVRVTGHEEYLHMNLVMVREWLGAHCATIPNLQRAGLHNGCFERHCARQSLLGKQAGKAALEALPPPQTPRGSAETVTSQASSPPARRGKAEEATTTSPRPVLGLVPTHPPKYAFFLGFLRSFASCDESNDAHRAGLHIAAIFTTASDGAAFDRAAGKQSSALRFRVVLNLKVPSATKHHLVAWKRWMGLARLMDSRRAELLGLYEYVAFLDSETVVRSCAAMGRLPLSIERTQRRGWIAANQLCNGMGRRSLRSAALLAARSRHELDRLEAATHNFSLYFFWTELPWAPLRLLERMLLDWRERVAGSRTHGKYMSFVDAVARYAPARLFDDGTPFAQLVIVLYQLLHDSLRLRDMTRELGLSPVFAHVFGSFFEWAPQELPQMWEHILTQLEPLWLPGIAMRAANASTTAPHAALVFNIDRAERPRKSLLHFATPCAKLRPLKDDFLRCWFDEDQRREPERDEQGPICGTGSIT